jgi:hypothetical protein
MYARGSALVAAVASHHLAGHLLAGGVGALGGAGIGRFLVRLFIWHEIARLIRYLWHIPTFGPYIVIGLGVVIVGLLVWRRFRGPVFGGRGRGPIWGRRRGGSAGYGSGGGPRDW